MINIYQIVEKTKVLGKGERFAIWVQGCHRACKGCIAKDSWDITKGEKWEIEKLATKINNTKNITGLTISGGEPFLWEKELSRLLDLIKKELDVIVYTGYKFEEIKNKKLISKIDLLIDGEYIEEKNEEIPLIGSSNQKLYIFTTKGEELAKDLLQTPSREVEFVVKNNSLFVVGIPPKNLKEKI